jgi:hypothetical protein
MSSKKDREAIFAQRAGATANTSKHHPLNVATRGIRGKGHHSEVTRQSNPGRTNVARGK